LLVQRDPATGSFCGRRVTNKPAPSSEAAVYFVNVTQGPTTCAAGKALAVGASSVQIRKLADSRFSYHDQPQRLVSLSGP
jgi:hypothetical protein